jgi:ABC-type multidrug transport system permease subunit
VFNPPSGQTCAAWASDFVNSAGGYLDNPNDSAGCRYCQYKVSDVDEWSRVPALNLLKVGDEFFLPLNIQFSNRWRDVGIYFCFFGMLLLRFSSLRT